MWKLISMKMMMPEITNLFFGVIREDFCIPHITNAKRTT